MYDEGSSIMVLQQRKVSRTPISRDYIQTAEGGMLITSQNVMGTETYLPSEYGPGMFSRGITEYDGIVYFTDVERGVVCAVSGGQLRVISDAKVSNFFAEKLATVQSSNNVNGAILGIHPDQEELICSFQTFVRRTISSGGSVRGRTLPMAKSDNTKFDLSGLKLVYETAGSALDIVNESQTWNGHLLEWEEAGKGVVYTDSPTELGFIDSTVPFDKITSDLLVTNQRNDFFAKMTRAQGNSPWAHLMKVALQVEAVALTFRLKRALQLRLLTTTLLTTTSKACGPRSTTLSLMALLRASRTWLPLRTESLGCTAQVLQ